MIATALTSDEDKKIDDDENINDDETVIEDGSLYSEEEEEEDDDDDDDSSGYETEDQLSDEDLENDGEIDDDTATKDGTVAFHSDDSVNDAVIDDLIAECDDNDTEDFQKLNSINYNEYIQKNHSELICHTIEEIHVLCQTTRNDDGIIIDSLHKTVPFLTKFEHTRIIGQRAKQIASGCMPLIDNIPDQLFDPVIIAELELKAKRIPFIIKRPIADRCEYWRLGDLEFIDY
jgi:DNA-directed RNA polymerase subunit K/omega